MKKSAIILLAASGLAAVLTTSCGNSQGGGRQAEAGKGIPVIATAAPAAAAEDEKTAERKPGKAEEIGQVLKVNGSRITYETKDGRKETINAASMPSLLKSGDMVTVKKIDGKVLVAKYRGMKPLKVGC